MNVARQDHPRNTSAQNGFDRPYVDDFPLWPISASTTSGQVDALFIFLVALSVFMSVAIFVMIVVFAYKYRRRPGHRAQPIEGSIPLEMTWSVSAAGHFFDDFCLGRSHLLP